MRGIADERRWAVVAKNDRFGAFGGGLLLLPSGRLLCSYGVIDFDREVHGQVLIASADRGRTWSRPTVVDERPGPLKTTRGTSLSLLSDGRIAMLSDAGNDGFELRWSTDDGATWSHPQPAGRAGTSFYNAHLIETPDGLLVTTRAPTHGAPARKCVLLHRCDHFGDKWSDPEVIFEDPELNLTEPCTTRLRDGRLMCIVRENSYNFHPAYKAFSDDDGATWTKLEPMPVFGHELYAGQLADGRTLVAYRHVGGYAATRLWAGMPDEEPAYHSPATIRCATPPRIGNDVLTVRTAGAGESALYHMPPPESEESTVRIKAELRCTSNDPNACGVHVAQAGWVAFHPDRVELPDCGGISAGTDATRFRRYGIVRTAKELVVSADGAEILRTDQLHRGKVLENVGGRIRLDNVNAFGTQSPFFGRLDCDARGEAEWRNVELAMANPRHADVAWEWSASSGKTPDWYETERMIDIEGNYGGSPYYVGQAAWVQFPDGEIVVVNGRQYERPDGRRGSALAACSLREGDLAS